MIEPVTLYDSTTLTNGQAKGLDLSRMIPPGNRPMLVKDLNFTLRFAAQPSTEVQLGALVRARIRIGRFDTSNTPVPIWLYGAVADSLTEVINFYGPTVRDGAGNFQTIVRHRWVLPKPMYVPPGAAIAPTFFRDDSVVTYPAGLNANTVITVGFSARGLLIHDRMKESIVPFVGAFVPGATQLRSLEDDLRNTLNKTVNIHRLGGRVAMSGATNDIRDALGAMNFSTATAQAFRNQLRITDDDGTDITGGLVPFTSVFPAQGRSWTFTKAMRPGQQLIVTLDRAPAAAAWPMVSFVGSRIEPI